jgi:hypothetical protein
VGLTDIEKDNITIQEQEPIIVVNDANNGGFLLDGSKLCKRIAFANSGLNSY